MTWYFSPSNGSLDIYDHTGALVADGRYYSGGWTGDAPDEVYTVMQNEAVDAYKAGNTERALRILANGAFHDIEEGTP
ncbi:hypothetical protein [Haloarcula sp. JP-L23]|uniref:hypothetical protein n=1 Tax=Haloarcula sp. JP-L23 TaxID=2716717 RepID=UPI00140F01A7|nr:hypothetical protein G9465_24460 [Haloarcula sp. JP-L23]